MQSTIKALIESRVSANFYDASRLLSDEVIAELVRLATLAPSAYNLQNWRFIAVRSQQAKAKLKKAAFGQQKVEDASVTFIVCGTLEPHKNAAEALRPSLEAGILPRDMAASWIDIAYRTYSDNTQLQRDEAIRSASLAAMTMMLAAQALRRLTTRSACQNHIAAVQYFFIFITKTFLQGNCCLERHRLLPSSNWPARHPTGSRHGMAGWVVERRFT